ncbi:MAG: rhodanese-like domain-containing protein [Bacteroidetes bacterium]|nr:rhodanese-like domain-containing protein [Bacteroidota bacterium]
MIAAILIVLGIAVIFFLWYFKRQKNYSKEVVNYNIEETKQRLKDEKNTILLDVRTHMERRLKVIQGSIHIPLHDLKHGVEKLKKHIDKEIICYCHSGARSLSAAYILKQNGIKSANMKGGIVAWISFEKNK